MKRKIIFVIFISSFFIICFHANVHATEIPKVYFEGDISNMITKNDERKIYLKYTSSNLNFEKYTKIKIQGSSSIAYEKKNYTINFFEDETYDRKSKVDVGKGWGEQSNYCLKANWVDDKIQARNIVSARIAGKIQKKYGVLNNTPNNGSIDGFPIEVYSNGEFLGLYTWNIPKNEWTWNIDKNNSNQLVLGGDWYTEYTNFKTKLDGFDGTGWEVEIGESNDETVNNFNSLVDFINNSSDEEKSEFSSDNELLNEIYKLVKHTAKATTQDLFVDSQSRERRAYEGDCVINQPLLYAFSDNFAVSRFSAEYLYQNRTWPADYVLYCARMAYADYLYTGDKTSLESYYDILKTKTFTRYFDSSVNMLTAGGITQSSVENCILVDWPETERDGYDMSVKYNTVLNALAVQSYDNLAKIAFVLLSIKLSKSFALSASKTLVSMPNFLSVWSIKFEVPP